MEEPANKRFLLRSVVFVAACFFSFFVPLSSVLAATDNQTSGEVMTPQVTAEDLKVESSLTGGSVPFSFTLNNVENRGFFDIGYRVYILNSKKEIYLQKDFPKLFILAPFEKRNIESTFDLPKAIPAGDYLLQVEAIALSGAGLGDVQSKVKISRSDAGVVTFGNLYISSGDQKSPDAGGIAINPGDDVVAGITVSSKKDLTVKEQYKIYQDENFSDGMVVDGGQRLIKSGLGKYDFSVKSPENGGNFTMAYWLVDSDGQQVSPIKKFMWSAWRGLPGLNYISVDRLSAKKGENMDVEVALIPPVALENIGKVKVKVWVGNSYAEKILDFSKSAVALVSVPLKGDVDRPIVRAVVEKEGKNILNYKTNSKGDLSKNNQTETVNEPRSNSMLYLWLGMFFVASLVLVFFFVKKRKNAAKIVVFLLFGFSFIFFTQKDAFATLTSSSTWNPPSISGPCSPVASHYYINDFFVYKNVAPAPASSGTPAAQDSIFRPGDTIRFKGDAVATGGGCTFINGGFTALGIGSVFLGSVNGTSWDETYTIPASFDALANKNTEAYAEYVGGVHAFGGSDTTVTLKKRMTITMGPQTVDTASMGVVTPTCTDVNYNATFYFTGRALAENYDITWATDSGFTANVGTITTNISGVGAKSYVTTGAPFAKDTFYYWKVKAYNSNSGSDVTTTAIGNFSSPHCNLTMNLLPPCVNSNYGGSLVVFNWTASNGAGSYEVDVSQNSSFTTYAKKTITGSPPATTMTGTNTPTWSNVGAPSPALFDGSGLSLVPGTSYYWRVIARNTYGSSAPAYPVPAFFSVPACTYHLQITDVGGTRDGNGGCSVASTLKSSFQASETLCKVVTITNISTTTDAPAGLKLGVWATGAPSILPVCTVSPAVPTLPLVTLASIPRNNGSVTSNVTFNVGNIGGSFIGGIYVDPSCSAGATESDWAHDHYVTFAYGVNVPGWFNTIGGDVGAGNESNYGSISVGLTNSDGTTKQISDYLVGSSTVGSQYGVRSRAWQIQYGASTYGSLVPKGGIYNYFNQKFRAAAQAQMPVNSCPASGGAGNFAAGFTICSGSFVMNGTHNISGPVVVFVDGDLDITQNYVQTAANNAVVFLVSGNVTIDPSVTQADGVYIVKGTYNTNNGGLPLTVNGAVYANNLSLGRTNTNPATVACGNTVCPAETFAYDPKYMLLMNQLLGFSSTSWQEVAP